MTHDAAVEAAELDQYGHGHPRPSFFHLMASGKVDRAWAEVEAMVDDQKIGLPL